MKWLKKLTGLDKEEQRLADEKLKLEKQKAELEKTIENVNKKSSPKEKATKADEPYVDILTVEIDSNNPSYGSFELDWNDQFVSKLRSMGYPGDTDEVVVDLWFQSVCRNILMETWEQDVANRDNIRYINRRDLGDGKTEVS